MNQIRRFTYLLLSLACLGCASSINSNQQNTPNTAAVSKLGINGNALKFYNRTAPFNDLMRFAERFYSKKVGDPSTQFAADTGLYGQIPQDENGYPLDIPYDVPTDSPDQGAQVVITRTANFAVENIMPSGTYRLCADGIGTIQLSGDAGNLTLQFNNNCRDIQVVTPRGGFYLTITQTAAATHLHNLRLFHIDASNTAGNDVEKIYRQTFIDYLHTLHVGTFRFMQWQNTIGSAVIEAADRNTATYHTQSRGKIVNGNTNSGDGISWEMIIAFVKESGINPWVHIPHQASDAYIAAMAQYFATHLPANATLYVELSNEIWNSQYPQYSYAQNHSPTGKPEDWVGPRLAQIDAIMQAQFAHQGQFILVVPGFNGIPSYNRKLLSYLPTTALPHTVLAVNGYFGGKLGDPCPADSFNNPANCSASNPSSDFQTVSALSAAQVVDLARRSIDLNSSIDFDLSIPGLSDVLALQERQGDLRRRLQDVKSIAVEFGVPLVLYEGGQHLVGINGAQGNTSLTQLLIAANRDAQMELAYNEWLQMWLEVSGDLVMLFNDAGPFDSNGSWGLTEYWNQPISQTPKLRAVLQNSPLFLK